MTTQEKIKAKLEQVGLPYKKIDCYGRQIVVTSLGRDTASKWASVLGKFSKVKGVVRDYDYAKENKRSVLNPSIVPVWRIYSTIE